MLDPACGDGQFLVHHPNATGSEIDPDNARRAQARAPRSRVHQGDFFGWAAATEERFEAIVGNPPFIRYQRFNGETRARALAAASRMGADFSALTSSWAPFIVVAAGLLKPGGRMAFVVPAEIGHASYARPVLPTLCRHFARVHIVAYRTKLFPNLAEDCWLLYCAGYGGRTDEVQISTLDRFTPIDALPDIARHVSLADWRDVGERLRPFLLPAAGLARYRELVANGNTRRFGDLASAGVGYVSGANDFFHLRPSEAHRRGIPSDLLRVTVRKAGQLPAEVVDESVVGRWLAADDPCLLLDLRHASYLPRAVCDYLESEAGHSARQSYKCRHRKPWYGVPDVKVPDAFLTVMCGTRPSVVRNSAGCVCTNSLHAVSLRPGVRIADVQHGWRTLVAELGAEIEGHPLGGGMLKLEPRELARVPIPEPGLRLSQDDSKLLADTVREARRWRHHA